MSNSSAETHAIMSKDGSDFEPYLRVLLERLHATHPKVPVAYQFEESNDKFCLTVSFGKRLLITESKQELAAKMLQKSLYFLDLYVQSNTSESGCAICGADQIGLHDSRCEVLEARTIAAVIRSL